LATTLFNETAAKELIDKSGAKGFIETRKQIHIAGTITKEAIQKIEAQTGKKVVTHDNMKALNSPEIQKELAQDALSKKKSDQERNEFDRTLDAIMKVPKPDK
jgi:DNA-damage-inducible protein D